MPAAENVSVLSTLPMKLPVTVALATSLFVVNADAADRDAAERDPEDVGAVLAEDVDDGVVRDLHAVVEAHVDTGAAKRVRRRCRRACCR